MAAELTVTTFGFAAIFFMSATALFVVALVMVGRTWRVLRSGRTTVGTVVDGSDGSTGGAPVAVVQYHRSSGEKVAIAGVRGVRAGRLQVGDRVPVIFDPETRGRHHVVAFRELWALPLWIAAGGVVLTLLGVVALS